MSAALHTVHDALSHALHQLFQLRLPRWSELQRHSTDAMVDGSRCL